MSEARDLELWQVLQDREGERDSHGQNGREKGRKTKGCQIKGLELWQVLRKGD